MLDWSGAHTFSGGTVSITVAGQEQLVAPYMCALSADVSGSDFSAAPAASAEDWDETVHDLAYFWDLGDTISGDFRSASDNPQDASKRYWKGRDIAVPLPAGEHTITLTVYGMAGGLWVSRQATTVVTVAAESEFYASAGVIVLAADGDFTGAPAHDAGNEFTGVDAAIAAYKALTIHGVLYFKRGETYTITDAHAIPGGMPSFHWGAWGTGDLPVIQWDSGASSRRLDFLSTFALASEKDVRLDAIRALGPYDETTGVGTATWLVRSASPINILIHDCEVSGTSLFQTEVYTPSGGVRGRCLVANCYATGWAGYLNRVDRFKVASFVGNQFVRGHYAVEAAGEVLGGGPIRLNNADIGYVVKNHVFNNSSYGGSVSSGYWRDPPQPPLKFFENLNEHGFSGYVGDNYFEGGYTSIRTNGVGGSQDAYTLNAVIENNILLGAYYTNSFVLATAVGFSVRNNLIILPKSPRASGSFTKAVIFKRQPTNSICNLDCPNLVYSNTIANLRTSEQNDGRDVNLVVWVEHLNEARALSATNGSAAANNVFLQPEYGTPSHDEAEFDMTTAIVTPRSIGRTQLVEDKSSATFFAEFATPALVPTLRPLAGASVLGAASGQVARYDFGWVLRPTPATVGAWEGAA